MSAPAKLTDLMDVLEIFSDEHRCYFDRQTGQVVQVEEEVLSLVEQENEEDLEPVAEWQQEEIELARAIVNDESGRFIRPPDKFEFHEYRQMERFIRTLPDDAADQLWRAIKGPGAFRHFKDTARRLELLNQWYQYRNAAIKEFVLDWAKDNDVPVDDGTRAK
jgi:hypothetical protein